MRGTPTGVASHGRAFVRGRRVGPPEEVIEPEAFDVLVRRGAPERLVRSCLAIRYQVACSAANSFPGFMIPSGSSAAFTRFIVSNAAPCSSGM